MDTLFNLRPYNIFPEWDEYEIYHDESKENHIIHGFLLIPARIKPILLDHVNRIREKHNCDSKLHYNDLSGAVENIKHKTAREILILMEDALRAKRHDKHIWGVVPPRCKFVLFFKRNPSRMNSQYYQAANKTEIYTRKVETLLRIGLKGGLHHLFSADQKIKLLGFYTDGIAWSRPLNKRRIVERLYYEKEAFIDFEHGMDITPIVSNHKSRECSDTDRANLLQISDLLLGSFKACIFDCDKDSFKYKLAAPIRQILLKQHKRKGFFRHSGHHKAFALTKSSIHKNGKWGYENFSLLDEDISKNQFMNELPF